MGPLKPTETSKTVQSALTSKARPPWRRTADITWRTAAEAAQRASGNSTSLAEAAAEVYEEFTPDRRLRHLTEDLLPADEVVRRTQRKPTHLEEQLSAITRAVMHDIVTMREPSKSISLNLRLSQEEKEFVQALLKLRGYESEWDNDAPKLDLTEDHADSNGRLDQVLHVWVPASAWQNGQEWQK
jgi:hypothetical protein